MEPTELSLSPSCRILLVSKTNDQNQELVSLLGPFTSNPLTPHPNDEAYIEWTIKNKYYTAPVHIYLHQVSKLPAKPLWPPETDNERVPALIFVFRKGEPYREVFLSMKEAYLAHDAEVALAVSLPAASGGATLSTDSFDSIEEFFSDHGFEYVDPEDSPEAAEYSDHLQYDVRGLPRILEALNMIMWPSMTRTATGGLRRTQLEAEMGDSSSTVFEHSFATISETAPPDPSLFGIDHQSTSHSLAALNAWLDDDDSWAPASRNRQPATATDSSNTLKDGFDDDFTEFLSAPPEVDSDTGLPSSAEVHATAERIFGQDNEAPGGFDLTSILGVLEAMRLEIGAIEDPEERRKAAARVALGLAAGLGIDERDEDEDGLDEELMRELHQIQ
ncbi:unnamed protein product [Rhizoctonia solani]|uniref:Uncharacterized protein n=1 Tax=Rhizoctonia solani TaxID=456999 RepID=A0A8H3D9V9_9AGAM|nr:unnamed protein product [Rhizoctonia solani]CAE6514488.1 unnamed protein product [Rhizoctonia solani]